MYFKKLFFSVDMYNRKERNTDHFCHMICGYFMKDDELPEHDDDDDFEGEEEEMQFLNYQEMNGIGQGKQLYEGRKMKSCQGMVIFQFHFSHMPFHKKCSHKDNLYCLYHLVTLYLLSSYHTDSFYIFRKGTCFVNVLKIYIKQ